MECLCLHFLDVVKNPKRRKDGNSKQTKQEETSKINLMKLNMQLNLKVEYLDNDVKLITDGVDRKLLLVPKGKEKPKGYDDAKLLKLQLITFYYVQPYILL